MGIPLAFIGYGEVGTTFARDLIANGAGPIAAWDIRPERLARAREDGVRAASSDADAMAGAAVVISAVTADKVEEVAASAARGLAPGQIFVDVNSASPATKTRAARLVEATGAHYVEGAVMAPVKAPRLRVPILAGGPAAERAAALLNPLGMNIRPVSAEHGRASAMKLCRSIMIKGIEALIVDCAAASRASGVEEEVWRSLSETFPSIDWPALAETMAGRVREHGVRRAAEMREAAQMLGDLGMDEGLCRAVADAQERGAGSMKSGQE